MRQPIRERHQAFTALLSEFQDMAFGSAYALLGDYHSAEDAAQDAFVVAWQNLGQIRDARAFPGWLRQIVASQCHRRLRRKQPPTVPFDGRAVTVADSADEPQEHLLRRIESENIRAVLNGLPEKERQVTVLFYIADYAQAEIAAFTGLSVVAVRKRLAAARRRLKERILLEMQEVLRAVRPSHDGTFATRVAAFTKLFSALINEGVSLTRSFDQLADQEGDLEFRAVVEEINQELQAGNCLSRAMAKHPRFFSETYIQAIREGEIKGVLEIALDQLASGTYTSGAIPSASRQAGIVWENMQILVSLTGHAHTEPEHALLALLMSGSNQAVDYLKTAGVNTWNLKQEMQQRLAKLPKGQSWQGLSESLKEVHQKEAAAAKENN
ncbi:MAG: sigma-70 family RNA polymerase sigma factor, partial [Cytophagales bacterium]|nr:sigma-70 family RNA polymerase sigma factor [Armatimonadota bacterium]